MGIFLVQKIKKNCMDGTADLRYLLCYRPASKQYHNHLALSLAKLLERPFFLLYKCI